MAWYIIALTYFWNELLLHWLKTIFLAPFLNLDMLWILVPIWFSWFFAEFFQEKIGTSMGNAISNATIVVWASIDCARQTVKFISAGQITGGLDIFARFFLVSLIFLYGMMVFVLGWKGNPLIKKIGRIREMTYVFVMFVPIFYNYFPLTFSHVLAAILFFPLFYYLIELIDRLIPDPVAIKMDVEDANGDVSKGNPAGSPSPQQPSPSYQAPPQRPQQPSRPSPLLTNRRKGGGFWDFKL